MPIAREEPFDLVLRQVVKRGEKDMRVAVNTVVYSALLAMQNHPEWGVALARLGDAGVSFALIDAIPVEVMQ